MLGNTDIVKVSISGRYGYIEMSWAEAKRKFLSSFSAQDLNSADAQLCSIGTFDAKISGLLVSIRK